MLRRKHREKLHAIGLGNFFDMTQIHRQPVIVDKLDNIKAKNFRTSKDTVNRVKRRPTEWEKIFASHLPDKWLVSKIYEELLQLNNKRTNLGMGRWVKKLKGNTSKKHKLSFIR